jgi:hypothetical protein
MKMNAGLVNRMNYVAAGINDLPENRKLLPGGMAAVQHEKDPAPSPSKLTENLLCYFIT